MQQVTKKNDPGKTNHKNAIESCQIVVQGSFIKEHSFQNSLYFGFIVSDHSTPKWYAACVFGPNFQLLFKSGSSYCVLDDFLDLH